MDIEMRRKLAREPFPEKIRKVAQLIYLAKTFPRRPRRQLAGAVPALDAQLLELQQLKMPHEDFENRDHKPGVLTKREALELVSELLQPMGNARDSFVVVDKHTIEKSFGWVFFYQSKRFVETGEFRYRLAGNGPVIVNREREIVEFFGTDRPPQNVSQEYERKLAGGDES
jgi:hypothetical protein